jgi:hypothetical protein
VIATYPEDGAGTNCTPDSPDDCGVPVDAPIEVRFDRYLLPSTATRQSVVLYSGSPNFALLLSPVYDVVERVLSYRVNGGTLTPGLLYHAALYVPSERKDGSGVRAFDGAELERGNVPIAWSFRTARAAPAFTPPPPTPTCDDALSILAVSCAGCHAGADAYLGLRLDSGRDLRETALHRVARETEGADVTTPLLDPARFGENMPVIEPGSPGTSYLVYKLLVNPLNFETGGAPCTTSHRVRLPNGVCPLATGSERTRLENWFVRLDPMPPQGAALQGGVPELQALSEFIQTGADTSDCP